MSVLITGGLGYVGSHIAICLLREGWEVVCLDNLYNARESKIKCIEKAAGKKISFVRGDIRDKTCLVDTMKDQKIQCVIHCAGLKSVGESVRNPEMYIDVNVNGTKCVLDAMSENAINQFIYSSSATVYGNPEYVPIDENHKVAPLNPYGESKLLAEELVRAYANDGNFCSIVFRYFNPLGSDHSLLLGDDPLLPDANVMPALLKTLNNVDSEFKIFGDCYDTEDGTPVRDYVHVSDIATGHLAGMLSLMSGAITGVEVINLGTGSGVSVRELVQIFERESGLKLDVVIAAPRDGDAAISYANTEKATHLLGWKAKFSVNEMCKTAIGHNRGRSR